MNKPKRDPEQELKRRKLLDDVFMGSLAGGLLMVAILFTLGFGINFYNNVWLPSSEDFKIAVGGCVVVIICVVALGLLFERNANRIKALEKIVESEDGNHD